jgi:hypothetical protein
VGHYKGEKGDVIVDAKQGVSYEVASSYCSPRDSCFKNIMNACVCSSLPQPCAPTCPLSRFARRSAWAPSAASSSAGTRARAAPVPSRYNSALYFPFWQKVSLLCARGRVRPQTRTTAPLHGNASLHLFTRALLRAVCVCVCML